MPMYDTARTFEFLFRFNRVWINSRLLLLLLLCIASQSSDIGFKLTIKCLHVIRILFGQEFIFIKA